VNEDDQPKREIKKQPESPFSKRVEEIEKQAATVGQFQPLTRRTSKIEKVIEDIIGH
jgi:hypothetical protein